eukprot:6486940-Amphidinium_carterae.2
MKSEKAVSPGSLNAGISAENVVEEEKKKIEEAKSKDEKKKNASHASDGKGERDELGASDGEDEEKKNAMDTSDAKDEKKNAAMDASDGKKEEQAEREGTEKSEDVVMAAADAADRAVVMAAAEAANRAGVMAAADAADTRSSVGRRTDACGNKTPGEAITALLQAHLKEPDGKCVHSVEADILVGKHQHGTSKFVAPVSSAVVEKLFLIVSQLSHLSAALGVG